MIIIHEFVQWHLFVLFEFHATFQVLVYDKSISNQDTL